MKSEECKKQKDEKQAGGITCKMPVQMSFVIGWSGGVYIENIMYRKGKKELKSGYAKRYTSPNAMYEKEMENQIGQKGCRR